MTQHELTIAQHAADFERDVMSQTPSVAYQAFQAEKAVIAQRAVPAGVAQPGQPLPEAQLIDAHGNPTTLAVVRNDQPAVLVFYRGAWCPYCNMALRAYQEQLLPELTARGINLIAISPQKPDGALSAQETNQLSFTVVSDPANALAGQLGITMSQTDNARTLQSTLGLDVAATNTDGTDNLPLPTTLIADETGTIRWIDVRSDYTTRTEVCELRAAVSEHLSTTAGSAPSGS